MLFTVNSYKSVFSVKPDKHIAHSFGSYPIIDIYDHAILRNLSWEETKVLVSSPLGLLGMHIHLSLPKSAPRLESLLVKGFSILSSFSGGYYPSFVSVEKYSALRTLRIDIKKKSVLFYIFFYLVLFTNHFDSKFCFLNPLTNKSQFSFSINEPNYFSYYWDLGLDFFNWKYKFNFVLNFNNSKDARFFQNFFFNK